ncbi:putative sensor histidine kinase [Paramagnetospirillum caucaseum]|uniref:histidine kinase n=1 Tax=Paramagnetospirillum caucaseum TaxID=1244869 RepID=M2Z7G4_9PROT|nr:sensor histidine kinase [Paramagnetospirillum caucaseum]EME70260.1 putative sensor histidine kinase [Paramagnetospirillum caucaseum]
MARQPGHRRWNGGLPAILAVLCLLLPALALAEPAPLVLRGDAPSFPLDGRMTAHAGDDGSAPVDEIVRRPFSADFPAITTGTIWFRFQVERAAGQPAEWLLAFGEPDMDDVRVYVPDGTGGLAETRLGRSIPNRELDTASRLHVARLILPEGQPVTVHLRLSSRHKIRMEEAALWRPAALVHEEARRSAVYGLHMGTLLVLAVVSGLFGAWLRDGPMLAYTLYVATILCRGLVHTGIAPLIFSAAGRDTNYLLSGIGLVGGGAALLLLWDRILDLRRTAPGLHRLFMGGAGLIGLGLLLVLHPAFHLIVLPVQVLTAAGGLVGMSLAAMRAMRRRGEVVTRIYLLAFLPVVIAWVVEVAARMTALVPADLGRSIDIGASILHVALLCGALGYRLHLIQRARLQAELALAGEQLTRQRLRTFFDMVAHEFKTPLAIIDSAVQVVELDLGRVPPAVSQRFLAIRRAVRRLVKLIETCLAGERDMSLALRLQPMAPADLLERVVERNRDPDHAEMIVTTADLPERCVADAELLGIALDALIDNARRYGPADQPVEIRARGAGGRLELVVADRGPGVAAAEIDRIFEKYYRGSGAMGIPGTGLGLHLVKAVAEMHGGSVCCRPRDGGGAEFAVAVPVTA